MNCKMFDLAMVISGRNFGKIVTCLKLVSTDDIRASTFPRTMFPLWEVDKEISWDLYSGDEKKGERLWFLCPDYLLMPLSGNEEFFKNESRIDEISLSSGYPPLVIRK